MMIPPIPMNLHSKVLLFSVRDFVLPVEPTGDINYSSALAVGDDARFEGTATHVRIQRRLSQEHKGFEKEQLLTHSFDHQNYTIRVRGKLDCLFPQSGLTPPVVEEIKSSFSADSLLYAIERDVEHPYILQTNAYGWLYFKTYGVIPKCRLRIVSLLDESETLIDLDFRPADFERWVELQCDAIAQRETEHEARMAQRRRLAARIVFPFETTRPGQTELMETVRAGIESHEQSLLQAPTGLGKTAAVLFPALEHTLANDKTLFYTTPRNSQHRIAEEFVRRLRERGLDVGSVTLRAKEKMCAKEEIDCRAERCEYAHGYYDRLKSSDAIETLRQIGCVTSEDILEVAEKNTLCPFELSLDATNRTDLIICDYNYVFAPRATLQRHFGTPEKSAKAVVAADEAHNLQARACGWFSPSISHQILSDLNPRSSDIEDKKLRSRLNRIHKDLRALLSSLDGEARLLALSTSEIFSLEGRMGQLLADAQSQGERIAPGDVATKLFHLLFDFAEALRNWGPQFFSTWNPAAGGGQWDITCADASTHLRARLVEVSAFIGFSATLKPFEFHATLLGIEREKLRTAEFLSPFRAENRKLLVVPQISTAWRDRTAQIPRIAETISRILTLRIGNYILFFPSFDFMQRVLDLVQLPDFEILAQPRGASTREIDHLLDALNERRNIALFAVQGGSLAEGMDCPGDALIGTVVVGPPLPTFDVTREAIRNYYQETYGRGREYAYIYPAMSRAVQAAGRVIRGPSDRGLIVLLDRRFLWDDFARCMPVDWYYDSPKELVSQSLLNDISAFWQGTENE